MKEYPVSLYYFSLCIGSRRKEASTSSIWKKEKLPYVKIHYQILITMEMSMKEWFRNSTVFLCQGRISIITDLDCNKTSKRAIKPSCSSTLNAENWWETVSMEIWKMNFCWIIWFSKLKMIDWGKKPLKKNGICKDSWK